MIIPMNYPLTKTDGPIICDVSAEKGGVGKTTFANFLRDYGLEGGLSVDVIRIESRRILPTAAPGEKVIHSEDFAEAGDRVGGFASVFEPVEAILKKAKASSGLVVIDWGAGLTSHRLKVFTETSLDSWLAAEGIRGLSFVVTTREVDVMEQAARNLTSLRTVAPGLMPVLVLNELQGHFQITEETMGAQGKVFEKTLMAAAQEAPIIKLPLIGAKGWQPFQSAGIGMRDVLRLDPSQLAKRIGRSDFTTRSCISHVSKWWHDSTKELEKVLSFRTEEIGQ
jgi:hypothetical protein